MKYRSLPGALFLFLITAVSIPAQTGTWPKIIRGGILNKKAVSLPDPVVPPSIGPNDVEGSGPVNVKVVIDELGKVISATAGSGHPLLRRPAEEAALKARFTVALIDGPPVKVSGILVYPIASFHFAGSNKTNSVKVRVISGELLG